MLALLTPNLALAEKNEVIYANLSAKGDVRGVYVVNKFEYDRARDVVDYGDYSYVVNLTDMSRIRQAGDEISFSAPSGAFYYQGNATTRNLPWVFNIDYRLDGVEIEADELAGKSGKVDIYISIARNDSLNSVFFDNYMLSMSVTLDGDIASNIIAEDATVANSGKDRLLTYTLLPGTEKTYAISMDARNFELSSISINGVPMGLDIGEVDTGEIKEQLEELETGISSIKKGATQINAASQKLYSGANDLYTGSVAISGGITDIKGGSTQIEQSSGLILEAVNTMSAALGQLQTQAQKLKNGGGDLVAGAKALNEGIVALDTSFSQITAASATISQGIEALRQSSGSCSDEIKLINALIEKGANNADVRTYLSKEMAAMTKIIKTLEGVNDGLDELSTKYAAFDDSLGEVSTSIGQLKTASETLLSAIETYTGSTGAISDALNSFDAGTLAEQYALFNDGVEQLDSAISTLKDSYASLHSGIQTLYSGTGELQTGAKKLNSGTGELKSETRNMDEKVDEEVDKTLSKYTGEGFEPVSFMDERNDVQLVQFVLKTEAIEITEDESYDESEEDEPATFIDRLMALFK
ncbi:MAG: hypothetical protein Q4D04_14310 [Clostridia bacterium]|nr:hypothetical protein [Clostridia bacterium]